MTQQLKPNKMREIKFRVRNVDNKKVIAYEMFHISFSWHYSLVSEIVDQGEEAPIHQGVFDDAFTNHYREEYTGLKDKNGKEIYEGDIVRQHSWICVVEWISCKWALRVTNHKKGLRYHNFFNGQEWHGSKDEIVEVIGNIHEHSELIKD